MDKYLIYWDFYKSEIMKMFQTKTTEDYDGATTPCTMNDLELDLAEKGVEKVTEKVTEKVIEKVVKPLYTQKLNKVIK